MVIFVIRDIRIRGAYGNVLLEYQGFGVISPTARPLDRELVPTPMVFVDCGEVIAFVENTKCCKFTIIVIYGNGTPPQAELVVDLGIDITFCHLTPVLEVNRILVVLAGNRYAVFTGLLREAFLAGFL